jgi:ribosomal protein S18 acetylase RimI-like enzyme
MEGRNIGVGSVGVGSSCVDDYDYDNDVDDEGLLIAETNHHNDTTPGRIRRRRRRRVEDFYRQQQLQQQQETNNHNHNRNHNNEIELGVHCTRTQQRSNSMPYTPPQSNGSTNSRLSYNSKASISGDDDENDSNDVYSKSTVHGNVDVNRNNHKPNDNDNDYSNKRQNQEKESTKRWDIYFDCQTNIIVDYDDSNKVDTATNDRGDKYSDSDDDAVPVRRRWINDVYDDENGTHHHHHHHSLSGSSFPETFVNHGIHSSTSSPLTPSSRPSIITTQQQSLYPSAPIRTTTNAASKTTTTTTTTTTTLQTNSTGSSPISMDMISFRKILPKDRQRIQELHEEWFPVEYHDEFYDDLCWHSRMCNSDQKLYTIVATIPSSSTTTSSSTMKATTSRGMGPSCKQRRRRRRQQQQQQQLVRGRRQKEHPPLHSFSPKSHSTMTHITNNHNTYDDDDDDAHQKGTTTSNGSAMEGRSSTLVMDDNDDNDNDDGGDPLEEEDGNVRDDGYDDIHHDDDIIVACLVGCMMSGHRLNHTSRKLLIPGYPYKHTELFYIMTLGTVTEYRHLGLASTLVRKCISDVVEPNTECGTLYLHVITFNEAAIRFYEHPSMGFWQVQEICNYYTIDGEQYNCYLYASYFHGKGQERGDRKKRNLYIHCLWKGLSLSLTRIYDSYVICVMDLRVGSHPNHCV